MPSFGMTISIPRQAPKAFGAVKCSYLLGLFKNEQAEEKIKKKKPITKSLLSEHLQQGGWVGKILSVGDD